MKHILACVGLFLLASCGTDLSENKVRTSPNSLARTDSAIPVEVNFSCDDFQFSSFQTSLKPDPAGTGGQAFGITNVYYDSSSGISVKKTHCKENYERHFSAVIYREGIKPVKTLHLEIDGEGLPKALVCSTEMPYIPEAGTEYACDGILDGIKMRVSIKAIEGTQRPKRTDTQMGHW